MTLSPALQNLPLQKRIAVMFLRSSRTYAMLRAETHRDTSQFDEALAYVHIGGRLLLQENAILELYSQEYAESLYQALIAPPPSEAPPDLERGHSPP